MQRNESVSSLDEEMARTWRSLMYSLPGSREESQAEKRMHELLEICELMGGERA